MNYRVTPRPRSEIEIEVTLSFDEFASHASRAAALLSEERPLEGFRKGKAPYEIVKERLGEAAIYERAAEIAVRKTYREVMEKLVHEGAIDPLRPPIGNPEVRLIKLAPGNEFVYTVRVALLPRVILPDYKAIGARAVKGKKAAEVSEDELAKALEWLRESRMVLVTVDRPAALGDRVEIDFEVRRDGIKIAGGDSRNHPVTIGRGKFLPGFEDALVGMKTGEEKSFSVDAPPEWHEKSLAGAHLEVKTKMNLVQERQIPELTDELAKGMGDFSSADALRSSVKEGLRAEKEEKEKQKIRAEIAEAIAAGADVDFPELLIVSELAKMVQELEQGIGRMGMRWPDYLLHIKKTEEELRKEWRPEAEKRVRAALVLREIAIQEKIEVSDTEVEERVNQYLQRFKTAEEAEKTIDPDELREYTRGVVRNEKVFEFLEILS